MHTNYLALDLKNLSKYLKKKRVLNLFNPSFLSKIQKWGIATHHFYFELVRRIKDFYEHQ